MEGERYAGHEERACIPDGGVSISFSYARGKRHCRFA